MVAYLVAKGMLVRLEKLNYKQVVKMRYLMCANASIVCLLTYSKPLQGRHSKINHESYEEASGFHDFTDGL